MNEAAKEADKSRCGGERNNKGRDEEDYECIKIAETSCKSNYVLVQICRQGNQFVCRLCVCVCLSLLVLLFGRA